MGIILFLLRLAAGRVAVMLPSKMKNWRNRRLQVEQEISCDAYVMSSGFRRIEYASDIVRLVRVAQGAIALPGLYNTLAKENVVRERIKKILGFDKRHLSSKTTRSVIVPVLFLCCMIPILAVSFTINPVASGSGRGIHGVWINTEYSGNDVLSYHQKIIHYSNGTWSAFCQVTSPKPRRVGNDTVVEKWFDVEGNTWYKLASERAVSCWGHCNEHRLCRVNRSGDTLEFVSKPAHLGWPTEIDPKDPEYRVYYRQQ